MKLLLPDNKKVRQLYAYLVLKAIQNKQPYVTYEDVKDGVAMIGVYPNKSQVKKYLMILTSNEPPLLKVHAPSLFTIYYKLLFYTVDEKKQIHEATLGEAIQFKKDLVLILSDETTENTLTYAELLKQKILTGDAYEEA